jgi:hypothetical protein
MDMSDLPRNVLVVVTADDLDGDPLARPLLQRASDLATRTGGRLLLLSVCYEASLSYDDIVSHDAVDQARLKILEAEHARLEAARDTLARNIPSKTGTAVRWGQDRSAAVLRAGRAYEAELIMKTREDAQDMADGFTATDRDLLRDALVPVWLVAPAGARTPARGVVAFSGEATGDGADRSAPSRVLAYARRLSEVFEAPLHVVQGANHLPAPDAAGMIVTESSNADRLGVPTDASPSPDADLGEATHLCDLLFINTSSQG